MSDPTRKEFNVIVKRLEKAEDQLNDIISKLNDLSMNAVKKQDPIHIKLQNLLNESMLISPDYTTRIPDLSQLFDGGFNCYADEVVSKLLKGE